MALSTLASTNVSAERMKLLRIVGDELGLSPQEIIRQAVDAWLVAVGIVADEIVREAVDEWLIAAGFSTHVTRIRMNR